MSYRALDIIVYLVIGVVGYLVVQESANYAVGFGNEVSGDTFPRALGYLIIAFCIGGVIASVIKNSEKIPFPNMLRVVTSLAIVSLFVLSWSFFGYFYAQLGVFLFVILAYYRLPAGLTKRVLLQNTALSASVAFLFYGVFTHLMYVKM